MLEEILCKEGLGLGYGRRKSGSSAQLQASSPQQGLALGLLKWAEVSPGQLPMQGFCSLGPWGLMPPFSGVWELLQFLTNAVCRADREPDMYWDGDAHQKDGQYSVQCRPVHPGDLPAQSQGACLVL